MPSFKRREPGTLAQVSSSIGNRGSKADILPSATGARFAVESPTSPLVPIQDDRTAHSQAVGLRPSPYPSPVPLFSTGLASLDDFITGHGLPSSSVLVLCPSTGLTSLEIAPAQDEGDSARRKDPARLALERRQQEAAQGSKASTSRMTLEALKAAEDTLLDLMSYGVSQGLVAGHTVLVLGQHARDLVARRMPAMATGRSDGEKRRHTEQNRIMAEREVTSVEGVNGPLEAAADEDEAMKIAFRYAHRPKFKTTVDEPTMISSDAKTIPEEHKFRAPFDLSKHWTAEQIAAAERNEKGCLHISETTRYDEAWQIIESEVGRCKEARQMGKTQPVIRIHLASLGSSAWSRPHESMQHRLVYLSRFLVRVRQMLRGLALDVKPAINAICTATISSELLSPPWQQIVTHHLLRLADAQVLLSDFSTDKHLARAYSGYGGSVLLMKGPSLGSISSPGEKRSILRGGGGEAGAENDVGWRRRPRGRGIVLETLHEDVDADLKNEDVIGGSAHDLAAKRTTQHHGDDIEEAAKGLARRPRQGIPSLAGQGHHHGHHHGQEHGSAEDEAGGKEIRDTSPQKGSGRPTIRFEGLKSLRERGLRAAAKPAAIDVEQEKQ